MKVYPSQGLFNSHAYLNHFCEGGLHPLTCHYLPDNPDCPFSALFYRLPFIQYFSSSFSNNNHILFLTKHLTLVGIS